MVQRYRLRQKQFDDLFAEGKRILETSNNRDAEAAAKKFLQAVTIAPLVWTKHRFYAFLVFQAAKAESNRMTRQETDVGAITDAFVENENG